MQRNRSGLLILLPLLGGCGADLDSVRRVTPQELHDALAQLTAVAVDVRGTSSYKQGHIKGAADIPLSDIDERAGALPRERLIVTYCS
jgi:rhodanese-related sulfurtransferase